MYIYCKKKNFGSCTLSEVTNIMGHFHLTVAGEYWCWFTTSSTEALDHWEEEVFRPGAAGNPEENAGCDHPQKEHQNWRRASG